MTPGAVLDRLTALGASLTPTPEGTLRYRGPAYLLPAEEQQELDTLKKELGQYKTAILAQLTPGRESAAALPPCAVCGGVDRWCDVEVWRCRTCWDSPLTIQARARHTQEELERRTHTWRPRGVGNDKK